MHVIDAGPKTGIDVLLYEEQPLIKTGIEEVIRDTHDIRISSVAQNNSEVMYEIRNKVFDVILMDSSFSKRKGIQLLDTLKEKNISVPILILNFFYDDEGFVIKYLQAGAKGYLNKETSGEELINAIKRVAHGYRYITPVVAEKITEVVVDEATDIGMEKLSFRESSVLSLIAKGKSMKEIAEELRISPQSVSTYKKRMMEKLAFKNDRALFLFAHKEKSF